jgi:PhnB protein
MAVSAKPIPEGFHTVTPALVVRDAAKAIDFYKKAFRAQELVRMPSPDGKIMHAELKIGDSIIFLSEECRCQAA